MKRITAIELHNFLAFYGTDNKIGLPKGENLLLYGENGSGKSSLCRALEMFFEARLHPQFDVHQRNIWATSATDAPTDLRVTFDKTTPTPTPPLPDAPQTLDMKTASGTTWIEESRLASGFLTYRDILKTHFWEEHRQNLFDLVVNEILRGQKSPTSGKILSDEWADFERVWDDFLKEAWGDPLSTRTDEFGDEKKVMDIISDEVARLGELSEEFDVAIESVLKDLNPKINEFLAFFEQNISVELVVSDHKDQFGNPEKGTILSYHNLDTDIDLLKTLRDGAVDSEVQKGAKTLLQNLTLKKPLITAEVHYFGRFIPEHQTFLNEARLSALAICIFLAALRLKPDPKDGCKVLFLDDVLIGLDSGNRLPLFQILEKHFADFQIFLSTYDRHWFELSKDGLPIETWFSSELYAKTEFDAAGIVIREVPKLFPNKGNLELAWAYFEQFDYPAAGNALRKECERILKNYMEPGYLMSNNGNLLMLGNLLLNLTEYFEDAGQLIPNDVLSQIIFFKNALFNPASHHDLRSDFYRKEIEKAFIAVEKLKNLPKISWTPILHPCQEFEFENVAVNFKAKVLVGDYVYKTKFDVTESISKLRFYTDWWEKDGVEFWNPKTKARHTNKEIAGLTTNKRNEFELSTWLVKMVGSGAVDVRNELKDTGGLLAQYLT
jgi:energy-coupling factor transporter ATP-binding protein EcfA2